MSDLINIARHASSESFHEVLKRVVAAQPEIYMSGHEGYYRHDDIARLVLEIADLDALRATVRSSPPRLCGYCDAWHSKPCGEGCRLRLQDPTFADRLADAGKAITPATSGRI